MREFQVYLSVFERYHQLAFHTMQELLLELLDSKLPWSFSFWHKLLKILALIRRSNDIGIDVVDRANAEAHFNALPYYPEERRKSIRLELSRFRKEAALVGI